jgi:hypothetical protein
VEAASLSTTKLLISSGFKCWRFGTGNPSTIYNGLELPAEPTPLILMVALDPGSPEFCCTTTPGAAPCRMFSTLDAGKSSINFLSTVDNDVDKGHVLGAKP